MSVKEKKCLQKSDQIRSVSDVFFSGSDLLRQDTTNRNGRIPIGIGKILCHENPIGFRAPGFRFNPLEFERFSSDSDEFRPNPVIDPIGNPRNRKSEGSTWVHVSDKIRL